MKKLIAGVITGLALAGGVASATIVGLGNGTQIANAFAVFQPTK
jgi:hypothetical protein